MAMAPNAATTNLGTPNATGPTLDTPLANPTTPIAQATPLVTMTG
jgi:hypothetical protein